MIPITDVVGQVAWVAEAYVIAVIVPPAVDVVSRDVRDPAPPDKCTVIFVGGMIEVRRHEAERVIALMTAPVDAQRPDGHAAYRSVAAAAAVLDV